MSWTPIWWHDGKYRSMIRSHDNLQCMWWDSRHFIGLHKRSIYSLHIIGAVVLNYCSIFDVWVLCLFFLCRILFKSKKLQKKLCHMPKHRYVVNSSWHKYHMTYACALCVCSMCARVQYVCTIYVRIRVCVLAYVRVCVCVCACVYNVLLQSVRARACVHMCMCTQCMSATCACARVCVFV